MYRFLVFSAFLALFLPSCIEVSNHFSVIPPGIYRGVLMLDPSTVTPNPKGKPLPEKQNMKFEEVTRGELPFQFEVAYGNADSLIFTFINGAERIETRDVELWHSKVHNRDSIRIHFKEFNSYLQAAYRENVLEGEWIRTDRDGASIPFIARNGQDYRFSNVKKAAAANISGQWAAKFNDGVDSFPAVGEFDLQGNLLTGTFRTETGDYRYLAGEMLGDKLYLSCFDGSHAFLFEGKLVNNEIEGIFRSGKKYICAWTAKRDSTYDLTNPDQITKILRNEMPRFSLKSSDGTLVSASILKGKVSVLQIMGSWCPNCKDETAFLQKFKQQNADKPIQILSLGFEYNPDTAKALAQLAVYKQKMGSDWPMLLAGKADKEEASRFFPMLSGITAFPTLLLLDKKGQIRWVHTGFDGPATSKYKVFERDFATKINTMLAE